MTTAVEPSNTLVHFDEALIQMKNGYAFMTCERISDTVTVHPQFDHSTGALRFTGRFVIGTDTGRCIPRSACADCARAAARMLAAIDVDWSDLDVMDTLTDDQKKQLAAVLEKLRTCDCDGRCGETHCCDTSHY